jgi:hypothetical protein
MHQPSLIQRMCTCLRGDHPSPDSTFALLVVYLLPTVLNTCDRFGGVTSTSTGPFAFWFSGHPSVQSTPEGTARAVLLHALSQQGFLHFCRFWPARVKGPGGSEPPNRAREGRSRAPRARGPLRFVTPGVDRFASGAAGRGGGPLRPTSGCPGGSGQW